MSTTPHDPQPGPPDQPLQNEWLLVPEPAQASPPEPSAAAQPPSPTSWRGIGRGRKAVALATAGVVLGGGIALATAGGSSAGASSASSSRADRSGLPGERGGPGGPRGVDGEQRVRGTLTGKTGSTVTVRSSSGSTATYTVTGATDVVRNGTPTALSAVRVGDPVLVHVLPTSSGGPLVLERLFAGTLPARGDGPGGFGGPPGSAGDDSGTGSSSGSSGTSHT